MNENNEQKLGPKKIDGRKGRKNTFHDWTPKDDEFLRKHAGKKSIRLESSCNGIRSDFSHNLNSEASRNLFSMPHTRG